MGFILNFSAFFLLLPLVQLLMAKTLNEEEIDKLGNALGKATISSKNARIAYQKCSEDIKTMFILVDEDVCEISLPHAIQALKSCQLKVPKNVFSHSSGELGMLDFKKLEKIITELQHEHNAKLHVKDPKLQRAITGCHPHVPEMMMQQFVEALVKNTFDETYNSNMCDQWMFTAISPGMCEISIKFARKEIIDCPLQIAKRIVFPHLQLSQEEEELELEDEILDLILEDMEKKGVKQLYLTDLKLIQQIPNCAQLFLSEEREEECGKILEEEKYAIEKKSSKIICSQNWHKLADVDNVKFTDNARTNEEISFCLGHFAKGVYRQTFLPALVDAYLGEKKMGPEYLFSPYKGKCHVSLWPMIEFVKEKEVTIGTYKGNPKAFTKLFSTEVVIAILEIIRQSKDSEVYVEKAGQIELMPKCLAAMNSNRVRQIKTKPTSRKSEARGYRAIVKSDQPHKAKFSLRKTWAHSSPINRTKGPTSTSEQAYHGMANIGTKASSHVGHVNNHQNGEQNNTEEPAIGSEAKSPHKGASADHTTIPVNSSSKKLDEVGHDMMENSTSIQGSSQNSKMLEHGIQNLANVNFNQNKSDNGNAGNCENKKNGANSVHAEENEEEYRSISGNAIAEETVEPVPFRQNEKIGKNSAVTMAAVKSEGTEKETHSNENKKLFDDVLIEPFENSWAAETSPSIEKGIGTKEKDGANSPKANENVGNPRSGKIASEIVEPTELLKPQVEMPNKSVMHSGDQKGVGSDSDSDSNPKLHQSKGQMSLPTDAALTHALKEAQEFLPSGSNPRRGLFWVSH